MLGMEFKGKCLFGKGLKFWEVLPPYRVDLGLPFCQSPECGTVFGPFLVASSLPVPKPESGSNDLGTFWPWHLPPEPW